MRIKLIIIALALVLASPVLARAQGRAFNPRTPQALGMGNAQIGIGGSYNALFYNPAGLGSIEEAGKTNDSDLFGDTLKDTVWEFQAISILAETNSDTQGFLSDIKDVDANNIEPFLDRHRGDAIYARIDSTSYFTMKKGRFGFGIAGLFDYTAEGSIIDRIDETTPTVPATTTAATPGTDTFISRKTTDIGGVIGASYDVVEEWLTLGAAVKVFNRWQTTAQFLDVRRGIADLGPALTPEDFTFDSDLVTPFGNGCNTSSSPQTANYGDFQCDHTSTLTAGGDLGAMAYLPLEKAGLGDTFLKDGRMQLGVTLQDIGRTRINESKSPLAPVQTSSTNDIPFTVDVGLAYLQQFEIGRFKLGADFRDLNRDQVSFADKFSIGAEMEFKEVLTLRAGMNETGLAAGAALRLWAVRLQGGVIQEKPDLPADGRDLRYYASLGLGWYN